MVFYRRRLPHWHPETKLLFLTWHLEGSLPRHRFPPPDHLSAGKAFVWMDRYLDEARSGPTWLARDEITRIVAEAIRYAADILRHFDLRARVVMTNHVHLLVEPKVAASRLLQSVKGFSAREANKRSGRIGEPFWQSEFDRVIRYIHDNPVRAGLVTRPEDHRWSSAYAGGRR